MAKGEYVLVIGKIGEVLSREEYALIKIILQKYLGAEFEKGKATIKMVESKGAIKEIRATVECEEELLKSLYEKGLFAKNFAIWYKRMK